MEVFLISTRPNLTLSHFIRPSRVQATEKILQITEPMLCKKIMVCSFRQKESYDAPGEPTTIRVTKVRI